MEPWFSREFSEWVADRLLTQLRSGEVPTLTPAYFAWDPLLLVIVESTVDADRDLADRLLSGEETVMWGALLSRRFDDDPDVTATIVEAFEREADGECKLGLLHHLTARALSDEQHEVVSGWLRENAAELVADQRAKFRDVTGPERLRHRLESDEAAYANKRWLYMYTAHALGPEAAQALITGYVDDPDPRVAAAAEHSLSLLTGN